MIRWQTKENVIVLQIRLSNPMAAPVRQFSRNLLCPAALPRLHRYDAGLLAALPTSLLPIPMKPPLCSEMIAPPVSGMISPPV